MASLSIITPRSFLFRIADVFHSSVTGTDLTKMRASKEGIKNIPNTREEEEKEASRSKLNINLDDLKTISTALLHYKRSLAKMGEMERAEGVGQIDQKFYALIASIEEKYARSEDVLSAA